MTRRLRSEASIFKYLGLLITENNEILAEIQAGMASANHGYFAPGDLLLTKSVCRKSKIAIYRTVINQWQPQQKHEASRMKRIILAQYPGKVTFKEYLRSPNEK